jgi:hypothetical protein
MGATSVETIKAEVRQTGAEMAPTVLMKNWQNRALRQAGTDSAASAMAVREEILKRAEAKVERRGGCARGNTRTLGKQAGDDWDFDGDGW